MVDVTTPSRPRLAATERAGTGATVVFLHGLGCEREQFALQMEALTPNLRLLSLDLPGHGDSPEPSSPSLDAMAQTVGAELRARNARDAVLVGHSAGGLIALDVATRYPDVAAALVVLDSNLALDQAGRDSNRSRATQSRRSPWRAHFLASMADAWGRDDGAATELRSAVFTTLETVSERVVKPLWFEILSLDSEDLWRKCPVPALYLRSRRDTDLSLLEALNPLISTVDLRPHCSGHWPHLQCPAAVNAAIEKFVAQLS